MVLCAVLIFIFEVVNSFSMSDEKGKARKLILFCPFLMLRVPRVLYGRLSTHCLTLVRTLPGELAFAFSLEQCHLVGPGEKAPLEADSQ